MVHDTLLPTSPSRSTPTVKEIPTFVKDYTRSPLPPYMIYGGFTCGILPTKI